MRRCSPSLRPAAFPPLSPPPICGRFCSRLHRYYAAVRLLAPSSTASSPRLPVATRITVVIAGGTRSPRFRRVPFLRDVAYDRGRATGPCIAAPHILPSASTDGLGPCDIVHFVAQSHTPQVCCVRFAEVVTFHDATLATGRALPVTRAGLPPAGTRQLRLAHP